MNLVLNSIVDSIISTCTENIMEETSSSSESSDEEIIFESLEEKSKITNYVSDIVPRYNDADFKAHFRLSRSSVSRLNETLQKRWYTSKRPKLDLQTALLLSLWTLANQESFRGISDRFGVGRGHAHRAFIEICCLLYQHRREFIEWRKDEVAMEFNVRKGHIFPNVIGCIDCTHIAVPSRKDDNSFYNRKGYSSIILQAVCDVNLKFIDIYVGWPGSANDARVWTSSPLYKKLKETNFFDKKYHLLGDSIYPLDWFLMKPFRDNGHLSSSEIIFNKSLSQVRVVIEQAFARLKNSFRRLKFLPCHKVENIKYIVIASCILHNISLNEDNEADYSQNYETEDAREYEERFEDEELSSSEGSNKRNAIMLQLTS